MSFVNRFVAINKESSYGVTGSTYYYGEVDDESFKHQYDILTRDDLSRYGASKAVTGKEYSSGDFNLALINDNFTGQLLKGIFPTDTTGSVSGGLYPHVFTEAGTFPTFTIAIGRETKEHYYKGCVVDSLSVSANINEYGMVSASMVGKAEASTENIGTLTATFADGLDALYFADAKVFFNGNATASNAVKSISFDINLNVDTDNACGLGNATYLRQPPSQRREISGTIEFNRILHSAVVAEPDYNSLIATDGVELSGSGVELKVQFGNESVADILTFNFYKIRFEAPESNVSGRDTQTMSVPFVALFSSDDSKMMDCTLKTEKSSAY
jgi:hypothetical protein